LPSIIQSTLLGVIALSEKAQKFVGIFNTFAYVIYYAKYRSSCSNLTPHVDKIFRSNSHVEVYFRGGIPFVPETK
jgi:hypothetical protein